MKKKDLYKIVKQSLKEVLQEQKRRPELSKFPLSADNLVDFDTGFIKTPVKNIAKDIAAGNQGEIDLINFYAGGPGGQSGAGGAGGAGTGAYNLNFWSVIGPTSPVGTPGNCNFIQVEDVWICNNPGQGQSASGGTLSFLVNGQQGPFPSVSLCAEHGYPNAPVADPNNPTHQEFLDWLTSGAVPSIYVNIYTNINPFQLVCPTCTYEDADNTYANAYPFPGSSTPPAGLTYSENASCIFTACNAPGYSNYFCINFPALCSNNEPDLTQIASINDPGLCEVVGCLNENSDFDPTNNLYGLINTGWICSSTFGSTLCTNGILNQTYTDNDGNSGLSVANTQNDPTLCNPIAPSLGCTVLGYTNYNSSYNVDDGSCEYQGCLDEQTTTGLLNSNWICQSVPALCSITPGVPNPTYSVTTHNITSLPDPNGVSFNATYSDPNNDCTQDPIYGCLDNTEILPGILLYPTYNQAHTFDNTTYATQADQNLATCGDPVITGCTNPIANNYHCDDVNAATGIYACSDVDGDGVDDIPNLTFQSPLGIGTNQTTAAVVGDPTTLCNYDSDNDGVDDDDEVVGCTDSNADNYGLQPDGTPCATDAQGNIILNGCTDVGVVGAFTAQNHIDNGCTYTVYGCTDSTSPAYLDPATLTAPQTATNTTIINQISATNTGDPCQLSPGCTDEDAINYVGTAAAPFTADNGSCLFEGCSNAYANNPTIIVSALTQYDGMVANVDDGSCTFNYCNTQGAPNYVCVVKPQLCIDPTQANLACGNTPCPNGIPASSYNSLDSSGASTSVSFTVTNTGCTVTGCLDPLAQNYDATLPAGALDDGSCSYSYCNNQNALNYGSNRPIVPSALQGTPTSAANSGATWISGQDQGLESVCEFEGCNDPSLPASTDPSTETFPGSGVYLHHPDNDGCQSTQTPDPSYVPGLNSTGMLSLQNTSCCANSGCVDNGDLDLPGVFPGLSGQQFWQQFNYDVNLGIAAYPGVSANNYNPGASSPDGSCTYNIGCTDPSAPNYDPNADIDTDVTQCLPACKRIEAVQCTPDPDPNNFSPQAGAYEHKISIPCAHYNGNSPDIGDEFWNTNGRLYTSLPGGNIGTQGLPCPNFPVQNYGIAPPPFNAVGTPGQILSCNPNSSAGSPQNAPMNGSAYCPGGYTGCTYIFGANPNFGAGDDKNEFADTGMWTLYPANEYQTYGEKKTPDGGLGYTSINAVFRIISVDDDNGPITNLNPWQCGVQPPTPSGGVGYIVGKGVGDIDSLKSDRPEKEFLTIEEVKTSKQLRKSLIEILKIKNKK
jgi:hypothetical protein